MTIASQHLDQHPGNKKLLDYERRPPRISSEREYQDVDKKYELPEEDYHDFEF
jgi:hypothetical protein